MRSQIEPGSVPGINWGQKPGANPVAPYKNQLEPILIWVLCVILSRARYMMLKITKYGLFVFMNPFHKIKKPGGIRSNSVS